MYPDMRSKSASLYQRALAVMPGGNTRHTVFFPPYPVYVERGEGCRIWDVDGVERIDCINNYSALIHGHCHPEIVEALREQAARPVRGTAHRARDSPGGAGDSTGTRRGADRFANSGTEGVMFAVMAARAATGRNKIAKIEGAYHGSYDAVEVASTRPRMPGGPRKRLAVLHRPGCRRVCVPIPLLCLPTMWRPAAGYCASMATTWRG